MFLHCALTETEFSKPVTFINFRLTYVLANRLPLASNFLEKHCLKCVSHVLTKPVTLSSMRILLTSLAAVLHSVERF